MQFDLVFLQGSRVLEAVFGKAVQIGVKHYSSFHTGKTLACVA